MKPRKLHTAKITYLKVINCEISLILIWSANYVIAFHTGANQATTFAINDTKLYVSVVILSTNDNVKLLQQLKSGFKCTINLSKCQLKTTIKTRNQYLDYLIGSIFLEVNRFFALSFENNIHQT